MSQEQPDLLIAEFVGCQQPLLAIEKAELAKQASNFGLMSELLCFAIRLAPNDAHILLRAKNSFVATPGYANSACECYAALLQISYSMSPSEHAEYGSLLLSTNRVGDALAEFEAGLEKDPTNLSMIIAKTVALMELKRDREAVGFLVQFRHQFRHHANYPDYLYQFGAALLNVGRSDTAIKVLNKCLYSTAEDRWHVRHLMASVLQRVGNITAAIETLSTPSSPPPTNCILLKVELLVVQGKLELAASYLNSLILNEPSNIALLTKRAALWTEMNQWDSACDDYLAAFRFGCEEEGLKRKAFALLVETGRYEEAIPIGASLVQRYPTESGLSETLQIILERRERLRQTQAAPETKSAIEARPFPSLVGIKSSQKWPALTNKVHNIIALFLRETRTRFGRSKLGYAWVIFEPLAHLGIMIALISLVTNNQTPPLGQSFALFYFTGVIPYYLFTNTISHVMNAIPENRPLLQLPPIKIFDVYIARAVLELTTQIIVAFILLILFYSIGIMIEPTQAISVLIWLIVLWGGAFGIGMLFSVLNAFFVGWARVWGAASSIIYFSSGIFYIPRAMPEEIRNILIWNPVLQAIELIRMSYFFQSRPYWVSETYLLLFVLITITLGFFTTRIFRQKLLDIE